MHANDVGGRLVALAVAVMLRSRLARRLLGLYLAMQWLGPWGVLRRVRTLWLLTGRIWSKERGGR